MKTLENKIPPPLLVMAVAAAMWGSTKLLPSISVERRLHEALVILMGVVALSFGAGGIFAFRRARTTIIVNPTIEEGV